RWCGVDEFPALWETSAQMVWTDCAPDRGGALSFLLPENLDQQALFITFTTIKIILEEPNG
ncbi:MAG: hypothetical protein WAM05_11315, partial [Candidatus Binataceae bacterium]